MARKRGERVKLEKGVVKGASSFFKYIKPYRGYFIGGFIFLVLGSLIALLFPYLMGKLLSSDEVTTSVQSNFGDEFFDTRLSVVIGLILVFVCQAIFSYLRILLTGYMTENSLNDLRQDAFKHMIKSPMSFFNSNKVGELTSRIATDINLLQETLNVTIAEFIRQIIIVLFSVVGLLIFAPKLSLIMLATLPVVIVVAIVFGSYIKKISKKAQNSSADSTNVLNEALSGIATVKSFSNEFFELMKFKKSAEDIKKYALKSVRWRAAFISFIVVSMFSVIVFIIWQGMESVDNKDITQEEFYQFIFFTIFIGSSIGSIPNSYASIQKAIGATDSLMKIMKQEIEPVQLGSKIVPLNLSGKVVFKDIGFYYPTRPDLQVLKDLNLSIESGSKVALVGSSGAGKSTVASLLLQFYKPTGGKIFFDDVEAEEYDLSRLRNEMTVVPQDVFLFNGSIKENILYGDTEVDYDTLIEAAKHANAHEFIMSFPQGYETIVGERGVQLSGGQRQRVAIARAILKDPSILILDEATSSLDSESEKVVQEALDKLMINRTSIIIAHRLSTIKNCDKILVFDKGRIVEQGTHDELILIENGIYKHLASIQFA